jgi:DNA polymerase-3 subunit beta
MKIIFNRQTAERTAAPLMCATGGKSVLATSEGILIEAQSPDICIFTTYDMEKGLRTTVEAKVIEGGSYIINAQKFIQTLKVMDGEEVMLTVDDKLSACITSGKSSHKMNALKGEDFPALPSLTSELGFEIKYSTLRKMIAKTSYAMGVNDSRPVLNGCYFKIHGNELMMVSCDGYKMAKCLLNTRLENHNSDGRELRFSFIIPNKTMNELYKLISGDDEKNVRIYMMRKHIIMQIGDITFFSRLIEGEYIDYDRIIVTTHKVVVDVDREELISALERAALVTEERIAGSVRSHVKLEFDDNILRISANSSAGSTYDEIETVSEGGKIAIAFNNRYLIDSIRSCTGEKIRLSLSSPLTSMNIQPLDSDDGSDDIFMLLPVRTKE